MKIGELARRAIVAIDTVRYYEREGLLGAGCAAGFGLSKLRTN